MAAASSSRARSATTFLVVAGDRVFVEYKPARGGWVADHLEKPNDAIWFERDDSPDGKAGLYRVGVDGNPGNRVEETIYAHELILPSDGSPPFTATQAFRSTATVVGRELMNRVSRKSPGGEVANPVLFKWRMTSQLERNGDYHWYKPLATLLGKFGEPNGNGPTIEEVRSALNCARRSRPAQAGKRRSSRRRRPIRQPRSNASHTSVSPTTVADRSPSPAGVRR